VIGVIDNNMCFHPIIGHGQKANTGIPSRTECLGDL